MGETTGKDDLKYYRVWHERGGRIDLYATDEEDAKVQFVNTVMSITGNILNPKNCVRVTKVELIYNGDPYKKL